MQCRGDGGRQSNFSATPRPRFAYQWSDNVKMYNYAKFEPNMSCGSKIMSILTDRIDAQQSRVHACQGLDNVDMHNFAKFDQNIPRGSRVTQAFSLTYHGRTD